MTDYNITPPPELVQQWAREYDRMDPRPNIEPFIATRAAQWGADQELEATDAWIRTNLKGMLRPANRIADDLRAARRPKPPSLKEQALAELAEWENVMDIAFDSPIRRALEQLDD
jgi:hypothetical protein